MAPVPSPEGPYKAIKGEDQMKKMFKEIKKKNGKNWDRKIIDGIR